MQLVIRILNNELEIARIQRDLHRKVKSTIDQNQKEYYLREQLKVIQSELGDQVDIGEEIEEYKEAVRTLNASEQVKEKISKEINRLRKMNMSSAESAVIRNYIDCMLDMPWNTMTEEQIDLNKAHDILEAEHYGLQKVKNVCLNIWLFVR